MLGSVEWYRAGLRPPQSVLDATDVYQSDQDRVAQFVTERCIKEQTAWVRKEDLYQQYLNWCFQHGYKSLGWNKLTAELRRIVPNFARDKHGAGRKVGRGPNRKTVRGCYGLRLANNSVDTLEVFAQSADSVPPSNGASANEDLR